MLRLIPWLLLAVASVALLWQSGRLGAARTEAVALRGMLEAQQQGVEQLKAAAAEQADQLKAAAAKAAEVRVEVRERVQYVHTAPVPDDCQGAVHWGAEQAAEFGQRWRGTP